MEDSIFTEGHQKVKLHHEGRGSRTRLRRSTCANVAARNRQPRLATQIKEKFSYKFLPMKIKRDIDKMYVRKL